MCIPILTRRGCLWSVCLGECFTKKPGNRVLFLLMIGFNFPGCSPGMPGVGVFCVSFFFLGEVQI